MEERESFSLQGWGHPGKLRNTFPHGHGCEWGRGLRSRPYTASSGNRGGTRAQARHVTLQVYETPPTCHASGLWLPAKS